MLIDTHAHLQFRDAYLGKLDNVLASAEAAGVGKIVCVGTDVEDSQKSIELAAKYDHIYATVGLHPHDAKLGKDSLKALSDLLASRPTPSPSKIVAIGECGLDYFYNHSDKADQETAFRFQIELAQKHNLPMVWHVRDGAETSSGQAFDDFFRIVDEYPGIRGIVHCFTSTAVDMEKAVKRGFYIALNGIMTFTKDPAQLEMAKAVPLEKLVLETDCPFLTPSPHRGKPNEPAYLKMTAEFLAHLRGESFEQLSRETSNNAIRLLNLT